MSYVDAVAGTGGLLVVADCGGDDWYVGVMAVVECWVAGPASHADPYDALGLDPGSGED